MTAAPLQHSGGTSPYPELGATLMHRLSARTRWIGSGAAAIAVFAFARPRSPGSRGERAQAR